MTVQSQTLKVPGARIYYEIYGSGPVLLMIPGGPADAGVFTALAQCLADRYTCVPYDPRGNSRSDLRAMTLRARVVRGVSTRSTRGARSVA